MNYIELRVSLPDDIDTSRLADISYVIADAAHRAKDWNDQADWSITQMHRGEFTVTVPMALEAGRR